MNDLNLRLFNKDPVVYIPSYYGCNKFVKDLSIKILNYMKFLNHIDEKLDLGNKKDDDSIRISEDSDFELTHKKINKLEKFVSYEALQVLTCLIMIIHEMLFNKDNPNCRGQDFILKDFSKLP